MKQANQRHIIVRVLIEITVNKKYNNLILKETLLSNNHLSPSQKSFITECVNGTIRNLIYIDYIINKFSNTHSTKMKSSILNILRSSVYQLIFMRNVPNFAICDDAVKTTKIFKLHNLSGFVNAVLRNISRNLDNIDLPDKNHDIVNYLSVLYSLDPWIIEYWSSFMTIDDILSICIYQNTPPMITISINSLKISKNNLIKILSEENITVYDCCTIENTLKIKNTSNISLKKSFLDGFYHIIDESSILCVKCLDAKNNNIIFDMCAAPGGKSFQIAYQNQDKGSIYSFDIYNHKINLMSQSIKRLGIESIKCSINDATVLNQQYINFADCVLVDAPCSGLGILQKKPDIKYNKTMKDIDDLVLLQRKILKTCSNYVKIGGFLIYSTCTISYKENLSNVNWFLENFDFELYDISENIPEKFRKNNANCFGYIQILPGEFETDGFFISKFIRKA